MSAEHLEYTTLDFLMQNIHIVFVMQNLLLRTIIHDYPQSNSIETSVHTPQIALFSWLD